MAINVNEIIYPSDILRNIDNISKNIMPLNWKSAQKFTNSHLFAICYGNGKFIAGGNHGNMAYSTDGITWTAISQSFITGTVYTVCYANEKFIAGGGKMIYSTDGVTWKTISQTFTEDSIINLLWQWKICSWRCSR